MSEYRIRQARADDAEDMARIWVSGQELMGIPVKQADYAAVFRDKVDHQDDIFQVWCAEFPDGRREKLLAVPRYDFNWQLTYHLAEPLVMPKGSKLHCTAHFDNSANNKANPDPTKRVGWGDQTWDEMMIGYIDYYQKVPTETAATDAAGE